ncbi:hypothetical protein KR074_001639 [Drosophila pseudoananassae]|nr:hypothetical protein KR074_001639 [Drosophila pseudoananassae]
MQPNKEIGMLEKHRNHIIKNLDQLVRATNYSKIASECVRVGILSSQMRVFIEDFSERLNMPTEEVLYTQHCNLFKKVTHRGPQAYNQLIQALRNVNCVEAAELLESVDETSARPPFISIKKQSSIRNQKSTDIVDTPSSSQGKMDGPCISKIYGNPNAPLTPYTDPVEPGRKVIKSDRIHTDEVVGTYKMQSRYNRGVLLMVNIIDFQDPKRRRNGAEVDSNSLIYLFREMGFTIFAFGNMDQKEFFDILNKVTSSSYARDTECFVMVLMTHGNRVGEVDKVQFHDGSVVDTQIIKNHFQAHISPNLVNKPKVLIFPFCRGDQLDLGQPINLYDSMAHQENSMFMPEEHPMVETEGMPSINGNVATFKDTLVCHANTGGYMTLRDTLSGSWYIQTFCRMMADHAHNLNLEEILKITSASVSKMRAKNGSMQMGSFDNIGFNHKLFFNPGFYLEE